jgi:hypothetical protein
MKKYIKPEIYDDDIEIEDIMTTSSVGEKVEEEFIEESGDRSTFPWQLM